MKFHPLLLPIALAVMTFAVLVLLIVAVYQTRVQATHIDQNTKALAASQERSCKAIHGAAQYWVSVRGITEQWANDPETEPSTRIVARRFTGALDKVISAANTLECKS